MTDSKEKIVRRSRWSHKRLVHNAEMNKEPTQENLLLFKVYEYYSHLYQILLPDFNFCSQLFIRQIENKDKKVIRFTEARDFYLPLERSGTENRELYLYCMEHPVLKEYIPDDVMPDRAFLLKIMATLDLGRLLEINKELLREKYLIIVDLDQERRNETNKLYEEIHSQESKHSFKKYVNSEDEIDRYLSELESLTDEEMSEDTKGYVKKQDNLITL